MTVSRTIDDAVRQPVERRLRSILMTSLATGAGAGARSAIGMVIVFASHLRAQFSDSSTRWAAGWKASWRDASR